MKTIYSLTTLVLGLLALTLLSPAARADDRAWHRDDDVAHCVSRNKPRGNERKAVNARTVQCGDVITASMTLAADLICPTTTGFALNVVGENITFDGNGHKIVAPLAAAGLFVSGGNDTVKNLKVNGVTGGDGILAYEAPGVKLTGNDVSGNLQGIVVYADSHSLAGAVIDGNRARNNLLFGVRTGFDAPGAIVSPAIRNNDVAGSGSYGMLVKASTFELGGGHGNTFAGSANGIYLSTGAVNLHDFSLAREGILNIGIFADSNDSLTATNLDLSSTAPATPWQSRIGLDVYRAGTFSVSGLIAANCDVGVKFETENGAHTTGTVTGAKFSGESISGILVVSYDSTSYGDLKFVRNCYRLTPPASRVILQPGTLVGAGSTLDDGLNICGDAFTSGGGSCGGSDREDHRGGSDDSDGHDRHGDRD